MKPHPDSKIFCGNYTGWVAEIIKPSVLLRQDVVKFVGDSGSDFLTTHPTKLKRLTLSFFTNNTHLVDRYPAEFVYIVSKTGRVANIKSWDKYNRYANEFGTELDCGEIWSFAGEEWVDNLDESLLYTKEQFLSTHPEFAPSGFVPGYHYPPDVLTQLRK